MDRALRLDHEVGSFGKEAGDRPQPAQRARFGEQIDAGIRPAGQIGLREAGFELTAVDPAKVFDRTGRRLGDRGPSAGLEIALATRPPTSKKLPPVAAVPMRKNRGSWASAAAHSDVAKNKLAQTSPRQICHSTLVSRGETIIGDDTMLHRRLQPDCNGLAIAIRLGTGCTGRG